MGLCYFSLDRSGAVIIIQCRTMIVCMFEAYAAEHISTFYSHLKIKPVLNIILKELENQRIFKLPTETFRIYSLGNSNFELLSVFIKLSLFITHFIL